MQAETLNVIVKPLLFDYAHQFEDVDEFADSYFGTDEDAEKWLDSLGSGVLLQFVGKLFDYYDAMPLEWLDNPQEIGNEIVGYLLREVAGVK